jgi:two-component system NarL family sensor kinase
MDDVNGVLDEVGKQVGENHADMMSWIGGIAFFCIAVIVFLGLILNLRERHSAQEAERNRFARELHDGVCQELTALKFNMDTGNAMLANLPDTSSVTPIQNKFEEIIKNTIRLGNEVRGIAHSLSPTALPLLGLTATLRQLVSSMDNNSTNITFSSHGLVDDAIGDAARLALYRVTQVSLDNVIKHARAQRVAVRLENSDTYTRVTISDDGIGFDASKLKAARQGMGLRNMKERMEELGGTLEIQSSIDGTTVIATIYKTITVSHA